jgi:antitoxin PrlF
LPPLVWMTGQPVERVADQTDYDLTSGSKVLHSRKRNASEQMESTITAKGQATIPRVVRQHLDIKPGDRVKFSFHPDGSVVLLPKVPVAALRGIVMPPRQGVTLEAMTEAVAAGAVGRGKHR